MKNFCITLILIFIISLTVAVSVNSQKPNEEYLRIHIRANSNEQNDQEVKYLIKDSLISYLTPYIAECKSKNDAQTLLNNKKLELENVVNNILYSNGFI